MTASVRERPAPARSAGADGGTPARRAVIRWAWRLFRREWRQQLLVLSLITVAVAGTFLGAAVASNTPASPAAATFGTANHLAMIPGHYPHGPGQVALTSQAAALYNIHAGGIWRQGGQSRRAVGIVENPSN